MCVTQARQVVNNNRRNIPFVCANEKDDAVCLFNAPAVARILNNAQIWATIKEKDAQNSESVFVFDDPGKSSKELRESLFMFCFEQMHIFF
jgi:hypothetical protein